MAIAPGKLLLFGEHAAVQGYPAVGVPLPLTVSFEVGPWVGQKFPGIPIKYHEALGRMIQAVRQRAPGVASPAEEEAVLSFLIRSELPLGAGFGSSGALATAAAKFYHPEAECQEIWKIANRGEQVFHGSPSGIDTGLSVYNQPLGFVFDGGLPRIKPLKARGITLVVSAVPREEDTYTYVSRVKARCASSPEAKDQLKVLGALSEELLSPREITPGALGAMTQEAQSILRDWGLVPQALDRVIQKTVGEGALGGKISGAGGGGAFYLVAEDPPAAANLQSFLQSPQGNQGIPLLIPPFLVEI